MEIDNHKIWADNEDVYLTSYLNNFDKKEKPPKPAVVVCPGGGYLSISKKESETVAVRFSAKGYQVFVLNYSIMEQARFDMNKTMKSKPIQELSKAIKLIKKNAEKWNVDSDKIVVCGFSSGGHLAASFCAVDGVDLNKPAALILSYPLINYENIIREGYCSLGAIDGEYIDLIKLINKKVFGAKEPSNKQLEAFDVNNQLSSGMPPTYMWHSEDDNVIDVKSTIDFSKSLREYGVPYELKIFKKGIHGEPFYDDEWFEQALKWLKKIFK